MRWEHNMLKGEWASHYKKVALNLWGSSKALCKALQLGRIKKQPIHTGVCFSLANASSSVIAATAPKTREESSCIKRSRESRKILLSPSSAQSALLFLSPVCARSGFCRCCWVSQPINWAKGDEAPLCSRARVQQRQQTIRRKGSGSRISFLNQVIGERTIRGLLER